MVFRNRKAAETRCPGRWWFRPLAVLLGLGLFAVAELVCVLADWGRMTDFDDPFVGFSEVHPLFVRDESGRNFEIAQSRREFFAPDSFPAVKAANSFRVFVLGGSTVQGRPFSIQTSFTTWLRLALEAADPSRRWEIVNCGGISYASYRLVPILKEVLQYEPDLIIVCTGHNEFLEDRSYGHIRTASPWVSRPLRWLARRRTFNLLRAAILSLKDDDAEEPPADRPLLPGEVDALLDHPGGLEQYHWDEDWRRGVVAHFENNLERMDSLAHEAGVPLWFILPPSNLCDSPPFKSEHRTDLADADLDRWQRLILRARDRYRDAPAAAVTLLEKALTIDDRYALIHYELGKCYEVLGEREQARRAFIAARDTDVCPLRMITPLEEAMRRVARETGRPLFDAHRLLEARCPNGILGDYLLVDHVHPSLRGHQLIAAELAQAFVEQGWIDPPPDWDSRRDRAWSRHLESLPPMYFFRGKRTLENLRLWAAGRVGEPVFAPQPTPDEVAPDEAAPGEPAFDGRAFDDGESDAHGSKPHGSKARGSDSSSRRGPDSNGSTPDEADSGKPVHR